MHLSTAKKKNYTYLHINLYTAEVLFENEFIFTAIEVISIAGI